MWSRSLNSTIGSRNCWRPLVDAATAATLAAVVTGRVGGFLRNVYEIGHVGTCDVCRGPSAGSAVCGQCSNARAELNARTCDHTLMLTYAQGDNRPYLHQSAHLMQTYKATPPVQRSVDDLRLIVNIGTLLHGDCIRQELGHLWDSVTYVPSSRGRQGDHPVQQLATAVSQVVDPAAVQRFLLDLGPGYVPGCTRVRRADRFAVSDEWQGAVRGKHVLVVDDTWTTGASIQSAAAALKLAGAESVTGLCAARWLKWSWPDHAALLGTCTSDYDALRCMVREGRCLVGRQP